MDEKETGRLEAFSDGVFAVAITLLVLNVRIPLADSSNQVMDDKTLWPILRDQWPMLVAYTTSFFTIGIMWLNHHRLFKLIKRSDTGLLLINLSLLATIVFIPVPTALLAEYLVRLDQHVAAIIYSATCLIMACCFNILWRYASYHNQLLGKDVDERAVTAVNRQFLFGPLFYLITFVLAWFSTPATITVSLILAFFFALPGRKPRISPDASSSTASTASEEVATSDQTNTVQEAEG